MSNLPVDPPSNEIPVARRESVKVALAEVESIDLPTKSSSKPMLLLLATLSLLGLGSLGFWQKERTHLYIGHATEYTKKTTLRWKEGIDRALIGRRASPSDKDASSFTGNLADNSTDSSTIDKTDDAAGIPIDSSVRTSVEGSAAKADSGSPKQLLNHRRYSVADVRQLVPLAPNSKILLQPEAQAKLGAMLADANASGVQLGVISGFRTIEDQNYLYFDLKAERGQSAKARAEVSAPPGYSEHHTGYAVDFIDQSQPATFLEESFETTPAYKWLVANAPFYNFEMSFPKGNGSVTYEPWHWRYVGNQESLELFYR